MSQRRAATALYQLPFGCVRISALGVVGKTDPFQQEAEAEAESDLAAGIVHLDHMFGTWLDPDPPDHPE